jgi:acyl carrier protein
LGVAESEITPDVLLVPDDSDRPHLGADSLDIVELSMAAEEEFNLSILDEDIDPLNKATFAELVGFVHGKCIEQGQRW